MAVDWGELAGTGPAEVDIAWFAIQDGWRFDVMPGEVFSAYDQHAYRPLEPAALGFKIAGRFRTGDEVTRTRSKQLLGWWVERTQQALSAWSPVLDEPRAGIR